MISQDISYFPKELLENASFKNIIGFNKDPRLNYLEHMNNLNKFKNKRVQFESVSSKIIQSNLLLKYVQIYGRTEFQNIVRNQNEKIRWIESNELGFGVIQANKNFKNDLI